MTTSEDEELWICKRKIHTPEHDGATGYFYYEPVEQALTPLDLVGLKKVGNKLLRGDAESVRQWEGWNKCLDHLQAIRPDLFGDKK